MYDYMNIYTLVHFTHLYPKPNTYEIYKTCNSHINHIIVTLREKVPVCKKYKGICILVVVHKCAPHIYPLLVKKLLHVSMQRYMYRKLGTYI